MKTHDFYRFVLCYSICSLREKCMCVYWSRVDDPNVQSVLRVINDRLRRSKRNIGPKAMASLLLMMIRMQWQINYSIFIYLWSITAVMSYRHSIYSM